MSRKKKLSLTLTIMCIILALIAALNLSKPSSQTQNKVELVTTQQEPEGQLFVVPETPLGILGIIGAFAFALGIFAIKNKHNKNLHQ